MLVWTKRNKLYITKKKNHTIGQTGAKKLWKFNIIIIIVKVNIITKTPKKQIITTLIDA